MSVEEYIGEMAQWRVVVYSFLYQNLRVKEQIGQSIL
jgi:hypothetical protein